MHKGGNKSVMNKRSPRKLELLEAEVTRSREELKGVNLEKSEISSELTTICRSQRQQLHGIKQAPASTTTPNTQPQGLFNKSSSSPDQNSWQAFLEDLNSKPFRTMNIHQSQRFGGLKNDERNLTSQPPGWAAF
ncbi:hypothetical protein L1987_83571 [Smallanthus sonchifolius]|uniref:Uncharacterized protein n=1 Tax=Smallanthus sonchifolius TaxID=185202 RepID=A0ACB8YCD3_9ASTR|nr:hypothetical protein L1987_83571 [Smallanthus sonchifolius]